MVTPSAFLTSMSWALATNGSKIIASKSNCFFIIIIVLILFLDWIYTKRKRGQFTSSTSFWYRQTPCNLKRVKVHAIRRELQLQFLITFEILPISNDKNLKVDIHPICPFYYLSQPIGNHILFGSTIIVSLSYSFAKIRKDFNNESIFPVFLFKST